jgi:ribosomal protein S18 acetylase RimI-like enzyme
MPADADLRLFLPGDLESVRVLIHRTIDACYTGVYPPRAVAFFKEVHSAGNILTRSRRGEMFVVEREGTPVATGSITGGEISGVFVDPAFQHAGIGARLMLALERRAVEKGLEEVVLDVSLPSRGFYERLGYAITETCAIDVGEGQRLHYWKAKKRLLPGNADG